MFEDGTSALDTALADVEQVGGFALCNSFANWRT
jgi:hypothetical protein